MTTTDAPLARKEPYSRAACLLAIIRTAALQLRQDAEDSEQYGNALESRMDDINIQVESIRRYDPLLK